MFQYQYKIIKINSWIRKCRRLWVHGGSNFCIMGSHSLLHLGALSVQLSEASLVLIAACPVSSNCILFLVVVSIVFLSHPILCPVVLEWLGEVSRIVVYVTYVDSTTAMIFRVPLTKNMLYTIDILYFNAFLLKSFTTKTAKFVIIREIKENLVKFRLKDNFLRNIIINW